jgi:hypothetical protein
MSLDTGVEAVAVIDVNLAKLNIKNINIIGVGKAAVGSILLQHVPEYRVVNISNLFMELFST